MFARVVGSVSDKRKRRSDGSVLFTVRVAELLVVDENNDELPEVSSGGKSFSAVVLEELGRRHREGDVVQLVLGARDTHCLDLDLQVATKGAYIEAYGVLVEEPEEGGGDGGGEVARTVSANNLLSGGAGVGPVALQLRALTSRRVSPFAAQVKALLKHAAALPAAEFAQCAPRLNSLLAPDPPTHSCFIGRDLSFDTFYEESCSSDFLRDLIRTNRVKEHVHKMLNYSPVKAVKRVKRIRPEEKEFICYLEKRVDEVCSAVKRRENMKIDNTNKLRRIGNALTVECSDDGTIDTNDNNFTRSGPTSIVPNTSGSDSPKLYNLPNSDASAPSAKGSLTRGEYMHGKKEPQVRWVLERLRALVDPGACKSGGSLEGLHVLDIGGGRGDLAVAIAKEMKRQNTSSRVTVVDMNAQSLRGGEEYAASVGVSDRISFVESDLATYLEDVQKRKGCDRSRLREVVVALHACGDLSDMALQHAKKSCECFVVVPCCFSKFLQPKWWGGWGGMWRHFSTASGERVPTHKIFSKPGLHAEVGKCESQVGNAKSCDDEGNDVLWQERRRAMGRIAESEPRAYAWRTMKCINILRMCDFILDGSDLNLSDRKREISYGSESHGEICEVDKHCHQWEVSVESFSIKYSGRNMALCGTRTE